MSGTSASVSEGTLLWHPPEQFKLRSNLYRYMAWLAERKGQKFDDYETLRRWSVREFEAFWASLWEYFDVKSSTPVEVVAERRSAEHVRWFVGSRINYAEHLLLGSGAGEARIAIHHCSEVRALDSMSWGELRKKVWHLATKLRELGIKQGDRVASYMPNVPETTIAMLATISIGAVWTAAAPEFGSRAVVDRISQVQPKLLFAADGYRFGGKDFDRSNEVSEILDAVGSIEHVIWLRYLDPDRAPPPGSIHEWTQLLDGWTSFKGQFEYCRVACDHPLWIVFSSGTTGLPKAIVHGHAGMLIEHMKFMAFNMNLKPGSIMFFYTTTGWIMFNMLVAALVAGAGIVQYDGNPVHPSIDFLWKVTAEAGVTCFGTSPTFLQLVHKNGYVPSRQLDLSELESVLVAGSPVSPEVFGWCYENIKPDLWVTSQSGGTEVGSAFVGGCPLLPVRAGEIQCRALGMDIRSWDDDGGELIDEVGELVCLQPFPSMPLYFWNDADGARYREAYFSYFPSVWRHGDLIRINRHGGCSIYGRSDATLNRHGVRIGSAELYRVVEAIEGIADSLVVCLELPDGRFYMPLFIQMTPGTGLDDGLRRRINESLRQGCSPRHVPDEILGVPDIPYNLSGKKLEVPVRKILLGTPIEKVATAGAVRNWKALEFFQDLARRLSSLTTA